MVLGTTNTTTLSATAPAASVVYTFPDVGSSCEVVLTAGNQTITGSKTYTGDIATNANLNLPLTNTASAGVIEMNGVSFIHCATSNTTYNTFVGISSGNFTLSGTGTVAVGANAGQSITSAGSCVLLGFNAGKSITSGGSNILIGFAAGQNVTIGSSNIVITSNNVLLASGTNNIVIGMAVSIAAAITNSINIGGGASAKATIKIGTNGTHTSCVIQGISGATSSGGVAVLVNAAGTLGTTTSSIRFKQNIIDIPAAVLTKLLAVSIKQFTYKADSSNEIQYGAIAEDVLPVWPDVISYEIDGVTPNTIQYQKWVPVLAKIAQKHELKLATLPIRISLAATLSVIVTFTDIASTKFILPGGSTWSSIKVIMSCTAGGGVFRLYNKTTPGTIASVNFGVTAETMLDWNITPFSTVADQVMCIQATCAGVASLSFVQIA